MNDRIKKYIDENWDKCTKENRSDNGSLIGLPYPYSVPAVGHFDEMYYWDTYFTNRGLFLSGKGLQAKNNTDNMLYLVNKYGFMPNGNRTYYLTRSQPPMLSMMVRDVYEHFRDGLWLGTAYRMLEREYSFWMTKRITPIGLNTYGGDISGDISAHVKGYCDRVGFRPDGTDEKIAQHCIAVCESGWDMTPRFGSEIYNFAPVDLNGLMYGFECNMEYFSAELGLPDCEKWHDRAAARKEKMLKYMDNGEGILIDYNFADGSQSDVISAGSFVPLLTGAAEERNIKAIPKLLERLETDYGISTCEKSNDRDCYQWDYPNGWPCLQYFAVAAMQRCGYAEDAKRVAEKYVGLVEKIFDETGEFWEKYNVADGTINVTNEYKMPAMMGWSAGVYLEFKKLG